MPVYLIFGASEDKNIPGMFLEIKPKVKRMFVTKSTHPRALEPEKIQELARQAGIPNEVVTRSKLPWPGVGDVGKRW